MPNSPLPHVIHGFGIVMTALGAWLAGGGLWRWSRWTHARGRVLGYEEGSGDDGDCRFSRIEVRTRDGRRVQFTSATGFGGERWEVGDALRVLYRERGGTVEGEVVSMVGMVVMPAVWLGIGLILLLAEVT